MKMSPPLYHLGIGELIICTDPSVISTVLGSCVSLCLYSRRYLAGGMIHYALPSAPADLDPRESFRYGDLAIPALIAELQRITGENPKHFVAKLIGGAAEVGGQPSAFQAGPFNVEIAKAILETFGIPIVGEDTGGAFGRKVLFHSETCRLQVFEMNKSSAQVVVSRARDQLSQLNSVPGDVDIRKLIAIGASTGGTNALMNVMRALPERIPPTVIVQHIPGSFSRPFAERLNEICPFEVKEAKDGDELKPSRVLIAPGGKQMRVERTPHGLFVRVTDDAPISGHKPSVDYLFQSVAKTMGANAIGVIMTGMGADGAQGLLQMRLKGAKTIGQDEQSCVVYGMPRVAYKMGAVERVASLTEIPRAILKCVEKKSAA